MTLAGCPNNRNDAIPCADSTVCNLEAGGECRIASSLGIFTCAYPTADCASGFEWGPYAGSIAGECVAAETDAGVDAPPIDAGIDSTEIDASTDGPATPPIDAPGGITAGMIQIPAGPFWRGCNPSNPNPYTCTSTQLVRETPYREITLSTFWIDKYEVTQEQWAACVFANGCTAPAPVDPTVAGDAGYDPTTKPDHPVTNVTWAQARGFCLWLGKRLPTEAEWEKAARGTDGRMYPWGDTAPTDCVQANLGLCTGSGTHAVGSHPAGDSPYGVSDMAGNADEYVADFYDAGYYAIAPATNPPGPLSGTERAAHGAAYNHSATGARVAYRSTAGGPSAPAAYYRGFRCAYSP